MIDSQTWNSCGIVAEACTVPSGRTALDLGPSGGGSRRGHTRSSRRSARSSPPRYLCRNVRDPRSLGERTPCHRAVARVSRVFPAGLRRRPGRPPCSSRGAAVPRRVMQLREAVTPRSSSSLLPSSFVAACSVVARYGQADLVRAASRAEGGPSFSPRSSRQTRLRHGAARSMRTRQC